MTFLDANVCIDVLARREPWYRDSSNLFRVHILEHHTMGTSVIIAATLLYLLQRHHKDVDPVPAFRDFRKMVTLLSVDEEMVDQAADAGWNDPEDAIQYQCALMHGADAIITRNKADFNHSVIPVLSPSEWLKLHG